MEENRQFDNNDFEEEQSGMVFHADSVEIEEAEEAKEATDNDVIDMQEDVPAKKDPMREILEWVVCIALALVLTFAIKAFLFDFVVVDGQSMYSTLEHGDRLVLTKIGFEPERGDIVVLDAHYKARGVYFESRRELGEDISAFDEFVTVNLKRREAKQKGIDKLYYVKRVIALPGDVVDIDPIAGTVSVNGEVLNEAYLDENVITPLGYGMRYPYTVEDGHVFVMGDNRTNSLDSRYSDVGTVPVEALSGKVTLRIWPLDVLGGVYED